MRKIIQTIGVIFVVIAVLLGLAVGGVLMYELWTSDEDVVTKLIFSGLAAFFVGGALIAIVSDPVPPGCGIED